MFLKSVKITRHLLRLSIKVIFLVTNVVKDWNSEILNEIYFSDVFIRGTSSGRMSHSCQRTKKTYLVNLTRGGVILSSPPRLFNSVIGLVLTRESQQCRRCLHHHEGNRLCRCGVPGYVGLLLLLSFGMDFIEEMWLSKSGSSEK